jgi:hypothetical protein
MMKDQKAVAQRSSYDQAPRNASGARADFSA